MWRGRVWNQKGFAKMLLSELAFDRCIGVYQVVNGRSDVPGTRKGVYVQAREMSKNREQK